MILDLPAFLKLLKKGDYEIIGQAYPMIAITGFLGYITLYFTDKLLGFYENVDLRLIAATLFIPLIFFKKKFTKQKIFILESILILCFPLFFSYQYFSTSEHVILSAEFIFCGFAYGLLTGRIVHTITIFPLFVMIGFFLSDYFDKKTTMYQFFDGVTLISLSIAIALLSSLLKLIIDSILLADIDTIGRHKRMLEEVVVKECADHNRNLERNLTTIKKLDTISKLVGGLIEDFIEMTKIISLKSMELKNRYSSDKNKTRRVDSVLDIVNKLSQMINRIEAFAPAADVEFCHTDINLIVKELTELLKETMPDNVRINVEQFAINAKVYGNKEMLEQAFVNICINASQAMPQGGELLITTENQCDLGENILDTDANEQIVVHFKDTGFGMDEKIRDNIFKPFFSTKGKGNGSGLGLVMVYETIKRHNGLVAVDSTLWKGTTFSISLPVIISPKPNADR